METILDTELQDWHNYEISSRREITSLLRQIGEKNQLVRMLIQGEHDVCVTSILDMDEAAGTMLVDCSINRDQNLRIVGQCPMVAHWLGKHPEYDEFVDPA